MKEDLSESPLREPLSSKVQEREFLLSSVPHPEIIETIA